MPPVLSRQDLIAEIDTEYARLTSLMDRLRHEAWTNFSVNSAGWTPKDVIAHVADWAERCAGWCRLGESVAEMTPPAPGFKWNETRRLNAAIHRQRRDHALKRVTNDFQAGHAALRSLAATMPERDLLSIGRFGWCGKTWSVAKHIRANTAAHYRWASKHFRAALRSDH
jgi:hypothetical protein